MRRFYDNRIKLKITLIIVAVMTVSFAISALIAGIYRYRSDRAAVEHHLGVLASAIGTNCSAALVFDDETAANEVLSALQFDHAITCAILTDEDSKRLASFGSCDLAHNNVDGAMTDPGEIRVYQRIMADGKTVGYLTIWGRTSEVTERLANEAVVSLTAFVVGVLFILMILDYMLRLLNAPLVELHETMRRVLRGHNYSLRARKVADDEIGDVVVAFNQLMEQVEAATVSAAPAPQLSAPATPAPAPAPEPNPATFKS